MTSRQGGDDVTTCALIVLYLGGGGVQEIPLTQTGGQSPPAQN